MRQARQFVDSYCAAAGLSDRARQTAVLLASETVTNAVVHARTHSCVQVETLGAGVRVEVRDGDSCAPTPLARQAADATENGRGLLLVETLADSWGTRQERDGKVVWFTVLERATRRSSARPRTSPTPAPGKTETSSRATNWLDLARLDAGLSCSEVWLRYFALGGMSAALEFEGVLHGALTTSDGDRNHIVHALNERFSELGRDCYLPYSDPQ